MKQITASFSIAVSLALSGCGTMNLDLFGKEEKAAAPVPAPEVKKPRVVAKAAPTTAAAPMAQAPVGGGLRVESLSGMRLRTRLPGENACVRPASAKDPSAYPAFSKDSFLIRKGARFYVPRDVFECTADGAAHFVSQQNVGPGYVKWGGMVMVGARWPQDWPSPAAYPSKGCVGNLGFQHTIHFPVAGVELTDAYDQQLYEREFAGKQPYAALRDLAFWDRLKCLGN